MTRNRGAKAQALQDNRDVTLGAKVRHFCGICGYRYKEGHLYEKSIAAALGVAEASWARMKSGKIVPDETRLSQLARHLRLDRDYGLTYEIFQVPTLGEFKEILKSHRVGSYGGDDLDYARAVLMNAVNPGRNGMTIHRLGGQRGGGIGETPGAQPRFPVFRPGDRVTIRVNHPEGGFLLVLNDCQDDEIVCLMPSLFAPTASLSGRITSLPTSASKEPGFPIGAVTGVRLRSFFRLFSIWTPRPLRLNWVERLDTVKAAGDMSRPYSVSLQEFRQLASLIDDMSKIDAAAAASPSYEIHCAEYDVM